VFKKFDQPFRFIDRQITDEFAADFCWSSLSNRTQLLKQISPDGQNVLIDYLNSFASEPTSKPAFAMRAAHVLLTMGKLQISEGFAIRFLRMSAGERSTLLSQLSGALKEKLTSTLLDLYTSYLLSSHPELSRESVHQIEAVLGLKASLSKVKPGFNSSDNFLYWDGDNKRDARYDDKRYKYAQDMWHLEYSPIGGGPRISKDLEGITHITNLNEH
jgi:hypothetical protein